MCCKKLNLALIIVSLPFIASLLFVSFSSPTLLVLTNINFSDIKQTCFHYKEYPTNYGLNQCFLPTTAILNNLFAIGLVITSVILIILTLNIFKSNRKKFKFQINALKIEVETLQDSNSQLQFENQRLKLVPQPHKQQTHIRSPLMHRETPNTSYETEHLQDDLPNYGAVVNRNNFENEVNLHKFPSVQN